MELQDKLFRLLAVRTLYGKFDWCDVEGLNEGVVFT
jgi:hypothetical protein